MRTKFCFSREKLLPSFLAGQESISQLASRAGCAPRTAFRAVNGLPVSSRCIDKIARALGIDAVEYLVADDANARARANRKREGGENFGPGDHC